MLDLLKSRTIALCYNEFWNLCFFRGALHNPSLISLKHARYPLQLIFFVLVVLLLFFVVERSEMDDMSRCGFFLVIIKFHGSFVPFD